MSIYTPVPAYYPFYGYMGRPDAFYTKNFLPVSVTESQTQQKTEIQNWLRELGEEERIKVLNIHEISMVMEPNKVEIFLRLYWHLKSQGTLETMQISLKNESYLDDLVKDTPEKKFLEHFEFRKYGKGNRQGHLEKHPSPDRLALESKLLQSLRVCSVEEFGDTIFVDRELSRNLDKLFDIFDKISNGRMFTETPEFKYKFPQLHLSQGPVGKGSDSKPMPWFDFSSWNTIGAVFLGFLECAILSRFFNSKVERDRKDSWQSQDSALPWRYCKEMPNLVKEFDAIDDGIELAKLQTVQLKEWLQAEDAKVSVKNPTRQRYMFQLMLKASPAASFAKLKEIDELTTEISNQIKSYNREKLFEMVVCPTLDQYTDISSLVLYMISKSWMDIISNKKIAKLHEIEVKKPSKKKKKKNKKGNPAKKDEEEMTGRAEMGKYQTIEESFQDCDFGDNSDQGDQSNQKTLTLGDEDTKCANTSHLSGEKQDFLTYPSKKHSIEEEGINQSFPGPSSSEILGSEGVMGRELRQNDSRKHQQSCQEHNGVLDIEKGPRTVEQQTGLKEGAAGSQTKNLIKKKAVQTKQNYKNQKRQLKKQQKIQTAKNNLMACSSSSDSFDNSSPLEKASCLSVAGSGALPVNEEQPAKKTKVQATGNLIVQHRQSFFDEEVVGKRPERCVSLYSGGLDENQHEHSTRFNSFDPNRKTTDCIQFGLRRENPGNEPLLMMRENTYHSMRGFKETKSMLLGNYGTVQQAKKRPSVGGIESWIDQTGGKTNQLALGKVQSFTDNHMKPSPFPDTGLQYAKQSPLQSFVRVSSSAQQIQIGNHHFRDQASSTTGSRTEDQLHQASMAKKVGGAASASGVLNSGQHQFAGLNSHNTGSYAKPIQFQSSNYSRPIDYRTQYKRTCKVASTQLMQQGMASTVGAQASSYVKSQEPPGMSHHSGSQPSNYNYYQQESESRYQPYKKRSNMSSGTEKNGYRLKPKSERRSDGTGEEVAHQVQRGYPMLYEQLPIFPHTTLPGLALAPQLLHPVPTLFGDNGSQRSQLSAGSGGQAPVRMHVPTEPLLLTDSLKLPPMLPHDNFEAIHFPGMEQAEYFPRPFSLPLTFPCPSLFDPRGLVPEVLHIPEAIRNSSSVAFLDEQVKVFTKYILDYSAGVNQIRKICKARIEKVAEVSFSGAEDLAVKTYGSWDTGLSIPGSDIDLLVSTPGVDKEMAIRMLETLEDNLKEFSWSRNIRNITSAQMPVLKVQIDVTEPFTAENFPANSISAEYLKEVNALVVHKLDDDQDTQSKSSRAKSKSVLKVDIIVETEDNSALKTTQYVKDIVLKWPELHSLVLLLKFFLSRKGLTNPYRGGLSSYAISLLVQAWLERSKFCKDYHGSLYLMFKDLIYFYSHTFDPQKQGICFNMPRYNPDWPFFTTSSVDTYLFVSDPVSGMLGNIKKNVTYNTFSFGQIQNELSVLYSRLNAFELDTTLPDQGNNFFLHLFESHIEENSD